MQTRWRLWSSVATPLSGTKETIMQQRRDHDQRPPVWPVQPQSYAQPAVIHHAQAPATPAAVPAPTRRHRSVIGDIFRGAFLGDFATDLGIAGAIVQIIFGFTPGLGDICAIRDSIADLIRRDWLGLGLNILALIPIAGGFPKTIEVIRTLMHMGHIGHIAHRRAHENQAHYA
jgi:hypothetical protein